MIWLRLLVLVPLSFLFGGWLLWSVLGALRSGVANAGGTKISVRRKSLFFWLTVIVQTAFACLALWLGVRSLLSP